ncbi:hypothetical protein CCR75_007201 [Bremia lactucae]|uniref:PUM-HD domain-containing protein n=1 Tax=Bremia lactucae TaxID=4779 RepID=A0A976IBD5_BRELC|nr:hypothetical protein CCR75_007201 [Bremia lactucae]
MGHTNSMSPAKGDSNRVTSSFSPPHASGNSDRKPIHHDNPVEPVRVKLQDPTGFPLDSVWSSEGLKSRSSLLFSASQALSERPASFVLRAPRLHSKVNPRSVQSSETMPRSEPDEGEAVVDNQKEENEHRDTASEKARKLSASWVTSMQNKCNKENQSASNHEDELHRLPLDTLQSRECDHQSNVIKSHPVNIWKNAENGLDDDYVSNKSPIASPTENCFSLSSEFVVKPIREGLDSDDRKAAETRITPGMSLIDRIQEDFPRTPSPEYAEELLTGRTGFDGRDQQSQSTFDIDEGIEKLGIGNYYSAPSYDSVGRFGGQGAMSPTNQHAFGLRHAELGGHGHLIGRSMSARFGVPYSGAMPHTYSSPYSCGAQGIPIMMAGQLRWAFSENAYSFASSPHGRAPSDFPDLNLGPESTLPEYSIDYVGANCGLKPPEKIFKTRSMYHAAEHSMYDRHTLGDYSPHPQMLQRPKSGGLRRHASEYIHPIAHSYSSNTLLEEFILAPKSEKWGLAAIKGHLFIFAKDQTGSRFIQQKLEKADDRLKADAFNEIFPNSLLLMQDVFGNYVIQKFLEYGSLEQQQLLVELMTRNVLNLALQVYGCRVIQRALEVTQLEEQLALIRQLKGNVMKCAVDQNGNHVLQKCIEAASWKKAAAINELMPQRCVTGKDIQFIVDSFVGQAALLSEHPYGCRVIQRVLEHCTPVQIRPLLDEIILKCRDLVKDQYGNYVVQHVISHGEPDQRDIVMQAVLPEIARWSQHKYASNVVESCLEHARKEEISQIVDYILQCDESGATCALLPMMKHMYGNYVVQKLLERADEKDRRRIVCIIRHNEDYLKRFTFGKHVLSRLERKEQVNCYY